MLLVCFALQSLFLQQDMHSHASIFGLDGPECEPATSRQAENRRNASWRICGASRRITIHPRYLWFYFFLSSYFILKKNTHQQPTIPYSGALSRVTPLLVRHSWCFCCACFCVSRVLLFHGVSWCVSRLIGCLDFLEAAASWAQFLCFYRVFGHAAFHFFNWSFLWPWLVIQRLERFWGKCRCTPRTNLLREPQRPSFLLCWWSVSLEIFSTAPLRFSHFLLGWLSLCRGTADLGFLELSQSCLCRVLEGRGLNFFPEKIAWADLVFVVFCR